MCALLLLFVFVLVEAGRIYVEHIVIAIQKRPRQRGRVASPLRLRVSLRWHLMGVVWLLRELVVVVFFFLVVVKAVAGVHVHVGVVEVLEAGYGLDEEGADVSEKGAHAEDDAQLVDKVELEELAEAQLVAHAHHRDAQRVGQVDHVEDLDEERQEAGAQLATRHELGQLGEEVQKGAHARARILEQTEHIGQQEIERVAREADRLRLMVGARIAHVEHQPAHVHQRQVELLLVQHRFDLLLGERCLVLFCS